MATTDSGKSGDQDVFGSLPSSRPQRRSAKRASASAAKAKTTTAKPKATTAKAAAKPKPKAAAKAKAKAEAAQRPQPKPRSTVPPAGYATPRADEVPSGRGDLLGTAVQAAGEIAQIGVAAGTRALSSALKRLPRP